MIIHLRNTVCFRLAWGLLSLYLLNISTDISVGSTCQVPKLIGINHQESIVEIILEEMLGFEDIIAEYDDPGTEEQRKKNNPSIDLFVVYRNNHTPIHTAYDYSEPDGQRYLIPPTQAYHTIISPPPKA